MPTGIEEFLGSVFSFILENAAPSAASGTADPNGAVEASDSAVFAPSPLLDGPLLEGRSADVAVADAPGDSAAAPGGGSSAPVDGDRPPPGGVYERPAIHEGRAATEYIYTEPEVFIVGSSPPPTSEPDADAGDGGATVSDAGPHGDDAARQPGATPAHADPSARYHPPLWQPPPPALLLGAELTPPALPSPPSDIGVPADWADAWERQHEYSWAKLLFDRSGEETFRDARGYVEEKLGRFIDWAPLGFEPAEQERRDRAMLAAAAQTVFDAGFGLLVMPVLDPSSLVRGFMRTGVASATGAEEIQQGDTLRGSTKIIGEVSAILLTVATPVRAMTAKGPPPAAGEASMTMHLETKATTGAGHNSVQIVVPPKTKGGPGGREVFTDVTRSDTLTPIVAGPGGQLTGGQVVAQAKTKAWDAAAFDHKLAAGGLESYTRRMSPDAARQAAALADKAAASTYKGIPGIGEFAGTRGEMAARVFDLGTQRVGPFSAVGEHCSTYAAAIARSGGVMTAGRFGPHATYVMFKYGLGGEGAGVLGAGTVAGSSRNLGAHPPAAP